jgi:hypothetical protein
VSLVTAITLLFHADNTHVRACVLLLLTLDFQAGFGVTPGSKDGTCSLCSAGTFSTGGSISQCDVSVIGGAFSVPGEQASGLQPLHDSLQHSSHMHPLCQQPPAVLPATALLLLPQPCPFGYTSAVGSTSKDQCVLSPQACPIGQWAPDDAVSAEGCRCYPGFGGGQKAEDPCTICPAGYFSVGKSLDKCVPCGFGLTSPVGSASQDACYPVKSCPAGTRECAKGGPCARCERSLLHAQARQALGARATLTLQQHATMTPLSTLRGGVCLFGMLCCCCLPQVCLRASSVQATPPAHRSASARCVVLFVPVCRLCAPPNT